jgi:capsular polysaccharide transport system permease protein
MKKLETIIKKFIAEARDFNLSKIKFNFKISILAVLFISLTYILFIQSNRYESIAKVIVNQSQPLESASNNFSSVVTSQRTKSEDAQLIIEYIKSIEMVEYLDYSIDLRKIYSNKKADIFSRLSRHADKDALHKYYLNHIKVKLNSDSSILVIEVQSFSAEDSRRILEIIIRRSEEFINKIFHDVAKQQLDFIRNEVLAKEKRILELEKKLRQAEAKAASSDSKIQNNSLRRKVDFAIQAHKESLEGLERVRAESAQNLKKLVVITGPTVEQDATYPKRTYNVLLFLTIFGLAYLVARSTYLTVLTHKANK